MKKSPPLLKIDRQTIIEAVNFVDNFPDQGMCEKARKIMQTHLPMHDNDALEAVKSIIHEYTISSETRLIFIGIAGKMMGIN